MATKTERKRRKALMNTARRREPEPLPEDPAEARCVELRSLVENLQRGNFRILAEKRRLQAELFAEKKRKSVAGDTYTNSLAVLNVWVRKLESALLEVHDRSGEAEIRALVVARLHSMTEWARGEFES